MSSSREDDPNNKPVTGYPSTAYPPAQPHQQPQPNYHHAPYPSSQPNNYQQPYPATAYPYTAPPPATYYNNNPNLYAQPYDPRRALFIRRLLISMIAVLIIFGAITFIVWLVLRPQIPQVRVESASVSPLNISNSRLTANWDIGFSVRNPNKKMNVLYDRIEASVFYRSDMLSETALPPFSQAKRNETALRARFSTLDSWLDENSLKGLEQDRSGGAISFNLRMLAWVRFKTGAWLTRRHLMKVVCLNVRVGVPSGSAPGTLLGGPKVCQVGLYS